MANLKTLTVETVFGIIKKVMGFRSFRLRGLEKMAGEWNLICLAYNSKRLHTLLKTTQKTTKAPLLTTKPGVK